MSLDRQRILIVGGTSGIGLSTAVLASQRGAEVIVTGRTPDRVAEAEQALARAGRGVTVDFTDDGSVERLMTEAARIDHLVLAASTEAAWGPFADVPVARLERAMQGKLFGYWRCAQAALRILRPDGSITMLGGAASRTAMPATAALAAVNGAITQLGQSLARELAPIRVNVISPGLVDTPAYDGMPADHKQAMFSSVAQRLPVGRTGRPEDIAEAILMVIGNGFITGALLDVDGGAR
ncbi:SDR family oxidoreductase [Inquilinus sp. OTU3971]|uniref:SDR family oxidoreductase n=1 Tax=Inquilinus sp. OTU3971 TaxID=3043855 RepID=UPI00313E3285